MKTKEYRVFSGPTLNQLGSLFSKGEAALLYKELQELDNHYLVYTLLSYASNFLDGTGVKHIKGREWHSNYYGHIGLAFAGRDNAGWLPTLMFDTEECEFLIDSPRDFLAKHPDRFAITRTGAEV